MNKKILICTFLLVIFFITAHFSIPVYAAADDEMLTVNAAWIDGEMIRIDVTDANGVNSEITLRLADYVEDVEKNEYISVQAVDLAGNKSGIIEIKNPYYNPSTVPIIVTPTKNETETTQTSQSAIPDGSKPFTPDGSGTVVDNVTDGDGKEFFSIKTEDGSIFYLIIDRQRNSDNVYLLNAVTLDDLVALAEKDGKTVKNGSTSAIKTPEQQGTTEGQNPPQSTQPNPKDKPNEKNDNSMYIFIGIAVIAAGGAGYYFKIVRGRKNKNNAPDDDDEDNFNDDYGYDNDSDEDEDYSVEEPEDGGDDE